MKTTRTLTAVLLVFSLLLSTVGSAQASERAFSDFRDAPKQSDWSFPALSYAVRNGFLAGSGDSLRADGHLSRAQLAAIVTRVFGVTETADISGFNDVDDDAWYIDAIARAVYMGALSGKGDQRMAPDDPVSREEAFAIIARLLAYNDGVAADMTAFGDAADVSAWAVSSVGSLVSAGIVGGDNGRLNPKHTITRAEFASLLYKALPQVTSVEDISDNTKSVLLTSGGTMRNVTIDGDLVIADGVALADVTLENVRINGRLIVRGGAVDAREATVDTIIMNHSHGERTLQAGAVKKLIANNKTVLLDGTVQNASGDVRADKNGKILTSRETDKKETASSEQKETTKKTEKSKDKPSKRSKHSHSSQKSSSTSDTKPSVQKKAVTAVRLSGPKQLVRGNNGICRATVEGTALAAGDRTVTWQIKETTAAGTSIDVNGHLKIAADEALDHLTVVATSVFAPTVSASWEIKLIDKDEEAKKTVRSVTVAAKNGAQSVMAGETLALAATVDGDNLQAEDKAVRWSIATEKVQKDTTVNQNGIFTVSEKETAKTVTVVATSVFDSNVRGAYELQITPRPPAPVEKTVRNVIVSAKDDAKTMQAGGTLAFSAVVEGDNLDADDKAVRWSIATKGIHKDTTVNQNGVLSVASAETQKSITVVATSTFDAKVTGTYVVNVTPAPAEKTVRSVTVSAKDATDTVHAGAIIQCQAVVEGDHLDAADKAVSWSVSGQKGATTIDDSGQLTVAADEAGDTVLTVTATSTLEPSQSGHLALRVVAKTKTLVFQVEEPVYGGNKYREGESIPGWNIPWFGVNRRSYYEVSAPYTIRLTVTFNEDGTIANIVDNGTDAQGEDKEGYWDWIFDSSESDSVEFMNRFIGHNKAEVLALKTWRTRTGEEIDALSKCTVSSHGFHRAVNKAFEAYHNQ